MRNLCFYPRDIPDKNNFKKYISNKAPNSNTYRDKIIDLVPLCWKNKVNKA